MCHGDLPGKTYFLSVHRVLLSFCVILLWHEILLLTWEEKKFKSFNLNIFFFFKYHFFHFFLQGSGNFGLFYFILLQPSSLSDSEFQCPVTSTQGFVSPAERFKPFKECQEFFTWRVHSNRVSWNLPNTHYRLYLLLHPEHKKNVSWISDWGI